MDKRLLEILVCPASHVPLRPLSRAQLDVLNGAISASGVQTTAGITINTPFTAGLVTTDGKLVYRIEDDIPVMLADEAINTAQFGNFPS